MTREPTRSLLDEIDGSIRAEHLPRALDRLGTVLEQILDQMPAFEGADELVVQLGTEVACVRDAAREACRVAGVVWRSPRERDRWLRWLGAGSVVESEAEGVLEKYVRTPDEELQFAEEAAMTQAALAVTDLLTNMNTTQRELAERVGVSQARISQILRADSNPTVRTMARIGYAMGRRMTIEFKRPPMAREESKPVTKEIDVSPIAEVGGADEFRPARVVRVIDDVAPEDVAMLQALYSRSADGVAAHLEKVRASGSGKFMARYYVGYGHKSISDCGTTTLFCENVSLLAAKAVQDWPLYCGQETSTRYLDMSERDVVDPIGDRASREILADWRSFYRDNQARVAAEVSARHPIGAGEDPGVYARAVQARAFDVLRGFLPAGVTTQLSWHTNLRQAADHLAAMRHHPAPEISSLAVALLDALHDKYPSSGFASSLAAVSGVGTRGAEERCAWEASVAWQFSYTPPKRPGPYGDGVSLAVSGDLTGGDRALRLLVSDDFLDMIDARPRGCVLPHFLSDLGLLSWSFLLDFGSFRDLQRHRHGVCRMPLLTTSHGFEPWYLDQLDPYVRDQAVQLLHRQEVRIARVTEHPILRQYYTALGYRVPVSVTYGLPATVYVLELRSGKAVHPTLRRRVHQMVEAFREHFPSIRIHVDTDPSDWDVRRGTHTITAR